MIMLRKSAVLVSLLSCSAVNASDTGENSYATTSLDSFLAYQFKTHQFRFGFIASDTETTDIGDGNSYIKYNFAF